MEEKWFAVYTKPRFERKVANRLNDLAIENYCPLNKEMRQWSDRRKVIEVPVFASYVFVRISSKKDSEVRQVPGVVNYVHWLGKPAVIKDEEINTIKLFLNEYQNIKLEKARVNVNDKVKIISGPLMAAEANVLAVQNKTVKVYLPSLGYQMIAEVKKSNIERM